jgi:hypothetical protein
MGLSEFRIYFSRIISPVFKTFKVIKKIINNLKFLKMKKSFYQQYLLALLSVAVIKKTNKNHEFRNNENSSQLYSCSMHQRSLEKKGRMFYSGMDLTDQ